MPDEIPRFPLDLVLLPSSRVPLHIFEERYRLMVNSCIDNESEFGIVWGQDDNHRHIGCSARIVDVVDRLPDGRLNIVVEGSDRFRLLDEHENAPYITGIIEPLPDEEEGPDDKLTERVNKLYSDALKFTLGWYRPDDTIPSIGRTQSYNVAASLGLTLEQQQHLLEMLNVNERLTEIISLQEDSIAQLQDAHKKTSGNGKA